MLRASVSVAIVVQTIDKQACAYIRTFCVCSAPLRTSQSTRGRVICEPRDGDPVLSDERWHEGAQPRATAGCSRSCSEDIAQKVGRARGSADPAP